MKAGHGNRPLSKPQANGHVHVAESLALPEPLEQRFERVRSAIEAVGRGEIVVVADDVDRENEGDLVAAAERVTPEIVNFMARHGRGLICLPMTRERLQQLRIPPMAPSKGDRLGTALMSGIDARRGVTTGISAADRAQTIHVAIASDSGPGDLVLPGHVFPLEARPWGVLERRGHTEAAVDLARLAGLEPAGVICEILRSDGTMARRGDLKAFAARRGLAYLTIEDLVLYRRYFDLPLDAGQAAELPTAHGRFRTVPFTEQPAGLTHLLVYQGDLREGVPAVRVHSECLTGDAFDSIRCDCGDQLREALRRIAGEGRGAVVYLRQEGRGIGLHRKIEAYALQDAAMDTVDANLALGFPPDARDYGAACHILRWLGTTRVRLLTNNPGKVDGLAAGGIEVVERVPLTLPARPENAGYLAAKREKLGHIL